MTLRYLNEADGRWVKLRCGAILPICSTDDTLSVHNSYDDYTHDDQTNQVSIIHGYDSLNLTNEFGAHLDIIAVFKGSKDECGLSTYGDVIPDLNVPDRTTPYRRRLSLGLQLAIKFGLENDIYDPYYYSVDLIERVLQYTIEGK